MRKIAGADYSLAQIFSDAFAFTIPSYQRPYAWTTEHAGELLEDLIDFMDEYGGGETDSNPYFLGSIVLIKEDDRPLAQVIDGQQRLATLTILLSAVRSLMSQRNAKSITPFLYEQGNDIKGTPNRYRLKLKEKDVTFFKNYIQDEGGINNLQDIDPVGLSDSQRNIRENALFFLKRLEEFHEERLFRLAQFIIGQCFMVAVSTPDSESAYRIFSVLNDRGLDLSLTDILKAEIIGKISSHYEQELYTEKWEDLEEALGRETFRELFAHIRTIYHNKKPKGSLIKEINDFVKPQNDPKNFIDNVLIPYTDAFSVIKNSSYANHKNDKLINSYLNWLNKIDNVDWIPPAISYFSINKEDPNMLLKFFTDLERLASGLMILRANVNFRLGRYGDLLTSIQNGDDLYQQNSPLQLTTQEKNGILDALNNDIYLIKNVPKYVLLRLDATLSDGNASYEYASITVEHVLPQTPKIPSVWTNWFPDEEDRNRYVHKLGNLVLLSRRKNSQSRNYDFDTKKQKYFANNKGVSPFVLTTQVLQKTTWTPEVIETRQEELITTLSGLWRL